MPGAVFLEGDNINLRTVEEEDLEFWRDNTNNPAIWKNLLHNTPSNMERIKSRFERINNSEDVYLTICSEDELLGIIWTHNLNKTVGRTEIAIWIKPDIHGNGYGEEAVEVFTDYLFDQLRVHKVVARSYDFNEASKQLWEKLGFNHEAVLEEEFYIDGTYRDVYYYGITEDEWES